ncbi:hypothetical protein PV325_005285 [Microctonus aethiopoides]|nr:hypothetical protein PV325_005285 [Microctonus aethiopoides]
MFVDGIIKSAASDTVRTNEEEIKNDESKNDNESSDLSEKQKEEAAATRIQAVFRGHHARKSMKETDNASQQKRKEESEPEPTKEQLQEEFRADDVELCNAATKIQASFRGHMSRKDQGAPSVVKDGQDFVESAASKIEEKIFTVLKQKQNIS